jgi:hypothetical protein
MIAYLIIGCYNIQHVGFTNDEIAHIGAIQSYTQGQGLNPEHPIFIKTIAAIILKLRFPELHGSNLDQWGRGPEILFNSDYQAQDILNCVRTVFLVSNSVFLIWIWLYVFIFKRITWKVGLIAAIIFVFSPSLIGHNYLIAFDVSGATWLVMAVLSIYFLFRKIFETDHIDRQTIIESALTGLFIFAAYNSKFSNIISVVPLVILFVWSGIQFYRLKQKSKLRWLFSFMLYTLITMLLGVYLMYHYSFGAVGISFDESQIDVLKPLFGKIADEFVHYLHGVNYILHRTGDGHQNFFEDHYTQVRFPVFVSRVFWFKENPVLAVLAGCGIVLVYLT